MAQNERVVLLQLLPRNLLTHSPSRWLAGWLPSYLGYGQQLLHYIRTSLINVLFRPTCCLRLKYLIYVQKRNKNEGASPSRQADRQDSCVCGYSSSECCNKHFNKFLGLSQFCLWICFSSSIGRARLATLIVFVQISHSYSSQIWFRRSLRW